LKALCKPSKLDSSAPKRTGAAEMCVFSKNRSEAAQRRAGGGLDNYDKTAPKQMVLKHGIEQKNIIVLFPSN